MKRMPVLILMGIGLLLSAAGAPGQAPPALDSLLEQISRYEHGQDRRPIAELDALLRRELGPRRDMSRIEQRLLELLKSDATAAGKEVICRRLGLFGGDASVAVLAEMAQQAEMAETARYALERIPGGASIEALRKALEGATGQQRIGWINSLGVRRDAASITSLAAALADPDARVAAAAADALASIGDPAAQRAIEAAAKASGEIAFRHALLRCAERRLAEGDRSAARRVYETLWRPGEATPVRIAALRGIASVEPEKAAAALQTALGDDSPAVQAEAIRLLGGMSGGAVILAREVPRLPPPAQARVMAALEGRPETAARRLILDGVNSEHAPVRLAALAALGGSGDASAVPLLAARAAAAEGAEQQVARESLDALRGAEADAAVIAGLAASDAKIRSEMIRAAGERSIAGAAPRLLEMAAGADAALRRESLRALRGIASDREIPRLIELLASMSSASDRREAERTLMAAVRNASGSWINALWEAFQAARSAAVQTALLRVMAVAGCDEALPLFRQALAAGGEVTREAILALQAWPDAAPLPDLMGAARGGAEPAHRVLALRGAIKLLSLPSDRSPEETVRLLRQIYELAGNAEEKRAVLAVLPSAPCPEALTLAEQAARDAAVAKEAAIAIENLRRSLP